MLGKTIREVRGDLSQAEFGAQVGTAAHGEPIPQTTISRWELGEVELTMEQVLSIEEAMGLRPGLLAEAAGYVISPIERAKDVESALRSDPNLDPVARPGLVAAYRSAVELSRRLRTGS